MTADQVGDIEASPDAAGAPEAPAQPRDRYRWFLLAIVGLALVLRVAYVLAAKPGDLLAGDQLYYSTQAQVLADGRGFEEPFRSGSPAADHPPLTALVLAPISWGYDPIMRQRMLMAVLGAAVVGAIGLLAQRVAGRRAGLLAAVLAALYANFWMNDGLIMSDTLSTLCITGLLLGVYAYLARPVMRRALLVGLLMGITALTRAEMLLVIPLVLMPVMLGRRFGAPEARADRWRHLGAAIGLTLLVLAPWTIFNATRFERPVLISTNEGLTLYGANCPDTYFGPALGFWSINCALEYPMPEGMDQSEKSVEFRRAAFEYLGDHPGRLPAVLVARELRSWSLWRIDQMAFYNTGEGREEWASWIGVVQYWLLLPVAVAGGIVLGRRHVRLLPLLAMPVLVVIVSAVFYGIPRFRIPAEITIVVFAAAALDQAWHRLTTGAPARLAPSL
jgi:4-amino-4-deoxy-L-arabinose transferase-like glycosyltransferase